MKNPIKSVLSCALSLALCVCLLPASAFAVEAPAEPVAAGESPTVSGDFSDAAALVVAPSPSVAGEEEDTGAPENVAEGAVEETSEVLESGVALEISAEKEPVVEGESNGGSDDSTACLWTLIENDDSVYKIDSVGNRIPVLDEAGIQKTDGNGNLLWEMEDGLTLTIKPKDGSSGILKNWANKKEGGEEQKPPWIRDDNKKYARLITQVIIEGDVKTTTAYQMFLDCYNLRTVTGKLDVSAESGLDKTMSLAFQGCSSLESLDLSGWKTDGVKEMKSMFEGCSALKTVTFGDGWKTKQVTNMYGMFDGCSSLNPDNGLDLSGWTTNAVTDMTYLFGNCKALAKVNLSNWSTAATTSMKGMFAGCENLTNIVGLGEAGNKWVTKTVTDTSYMFERCKKLNGIDVSQWDTSKVTTMSHMFADCKELSTIDVSKWSSSALKHMPYMFHGCKSLDTLNFGDNWTVKDVTDMTAMFAYCTGLKSIEGLNGWDTSNVEHMNKFAQAQEIKTDEDGNSKLVDVTVKGPNEEDVPVYVTDGLFAGCEALTDLSDIFSWNVSKITDLSCMFMGCKALTTLDLSKWKLNSETTGMAYLFQGCWDADAENPSGLTTLKLGEGWKNASQVNNMTAMFADCAGLSSIEGLEYLNTKSVTKTYELAPARNKDGSLYHDADGKLTWLNNGMFTGCGKLSSIAGLSGWAQRGVDLSCMFMRCYSLKDISPAYNWTVSTTEDKVKDMFSGCPLTAQDLSTGWLDKFETDVLYKESNLGGAYIEFNDKDYTGKPVTKVVTKVTCGMKTLAEGTDYEVKYIIGGKESSTGPVDPGTYKLIVKGKGEYTGSQEVIFKITKRNLSGAAITFTKDQLWTGKPVTTEIKVTYGGVSLVEGTDYEVVYENNTDVGTAKATVKGIGKYAGEQSFTFRIYKFDFSGASVTAPSDQLWTGGAITPAIAVTYNGAALKEGTDYIVSYENNVNVGTAKVTVTGIGSYEGSQSLSFRIYKFDFKGVSVTAPSDQLWTGSPITPPLTVTYDGAALKEGTDYIVSYENNINVGIARGTVTGLGKYGGEQSFTFQIITNPDLCQVMYRAYNPNSGEHFYTAHYDEVESIVAAGWQYEGEAWTAPVTSGTPVYRLYSGTDHHYTTSVVERDHLISVGWSDEGVGWYSDDAQGVGLHRLFNPNVDPSAPTNNSGSHHYTTSEVERDHLVSIGWLYEDFGWYGVK